MEESLWDIDKRAGTTLLAGWLTVRRGRFGRSRRRYAVLRHDLSLLLDGAAVVRLVGAEVVGELRARAVFVYAAGEPAWRLVAESAPQFARWRDALEDAAHWTLERFYVLHDDVVVGRGKWGVVRSASRLPERVQPPTRPALYDAVEMGRGKGSFSARDLAPGSGVSSVSIVVGSGEEDRSRSDVHIQRVGSTGRYSANFGEDDMLGQPVLPKSKAESHMLRRETSMSTRYAEPSSLDGLSTVVVKTVSRKGPAAATAASEALVGRTYLSHYAIVRCYDVFESATETHIVMEDVPCGSLASFVRRNGPLRESSALRVFKALLKAVGYMHCCGLVHWDIRGGNVLLANQKLPLEPKLIDFGTAQPIDPRTGRALSDGGAFKQSSGLAFLPFASPELLTAKADRYATKADMWQLGCLLYYMLTGKTPFGDGTSDNQVFVTPLILDYCKLRTPQRRDYLFSAEKTHGVSISDAAKDLVTLLITPNPRMRPSALQCLRNPNFVHLTQQHN